MMEIVLHPKLRLLLVLVIPRYVLMLLHILQKIQNVRLIHIYVLQMELDVLDKEVAKPHPQQLPAKNNNPVHLIRFV